MPPTMGWRDRREKIRQERAKRIHDIWDGRGIKVEMHFDEIPEKYINLAAVATGEVAPSIRDYRAVRHLREVARMDRDELCAAADVPERVYWQYESGHQDLKPASFLRIKSVIVEGVRRELKRRAMERVPT